MAKCPLPCQLPEASVWEMEITVYPLQGQSISPISTAFNRGRLVTSIRHDMTASEPIRTWWTPNMGGKTHLIQARPKDISLSLHFPIHTRWAAKKLDPAKINVGKYFQYGQVYDFTQTWHNRPTCQPRSYTAGNNHGRQNTLSSPKIALGKYWGDARLLSYPQPTRRPNFKQELSS